MSKPSKRARRIADLVQREIAIALQKEIHDPRLEDVSITMVVMSPDLSKAKIYYTLLDLEKLSEVANAFKKASGYLRHVLAENSGLRYTPQLTFLFDESLVRAEKITTLIDKLEPDHRAEDPEEPAE